MPLEFDAILNGERAHACFCPTEALSSVSSEFVTKHNSPLGLERHHPIDNLESCPPATVIVYVSGSETLAYFERRNLSLEKRNCIAQNIDLSLGLDWFTSYYNACKQKTAEGILRSGLAAEYKDLLPLASLDLTAFAKLYSSVCDPNTPSFLFHCPLGNLLAEFKKHGLDLPAILCSGRGSADALRDALLSHILYGFCFAERTSTCKDFAEFCRSTHASPALVLGTSLYEASASTTYPLPSFKCICNTIFRFGCPANHQRKSLLRQLRDYLGTFQYLPTPVNQKAKETSGSLAHIVVTLNANEYMRKPDLQKVATAHGLETSRSAEDLRNSIALHISSAHCFLSAPHTASASTQNGRQSMVLVPELFLLEHSVPRGCLDIYLDKFRGGSDAKGSASEDEDLEGT